MGMVYSLVVKARGLEYGGCEFKSRSLHWKPETELCEERGLSGCRKRLKIVPLAQALLSLKPTETTKTVHVLEPIHMSLVQSQVGYSSLFLWNLRLLHGKISF